jgi:hypothetical protein
VKSRRYSALPLSRPTTVLRIGSLRLSVASGGGSGSPSPSSNCVKSGSPLVIVVAEPTCHSGNTWIFR